MFSEYKETFSYRKGILPYYYVYDSGEKHFWYWMRKRNVYKNVDLQFCETKCIEEQEFTCVAFVYSPFYYDCTTLLYNGVDYPEFYEPVNYVQNWYSKLYARDFKIN